MDFCNAELYGADFKFHHGGFSVENGTFTQVGQEKTGAVDLQGAYVIPGLIDIHNHGNSGADFSDGDYDGLKKIASYLAANGITSFAATSMTLPEDVLEKAFLTAKKLRDEQPAGLSVIRGINMEGPFFSYEKRGAQNPAYLHEPDFDFFARLNEASGNLVRLLDIAPEQPNALPCIEKAKDVCTVSVAHTTANYEQAKAAFDMGATHVTHLFNAMPPLHHRDPGVIGAAAENPNVMVEMICDGVHLHPATIRAAFSMFGAARVCLISDALSVCGMPNGKHMLGGQEIFVNGRRATLEDGTLAGSISNVFDCLQNVIRFGIPKEDAVRCATYNPAKVLRALDTVGTIENGKRADFVVCDDAFSRKAVYLAGEKLA